jgi:CheY-like chemotaxis protein/HPt (histidine-containing phosphotransfer) domain-containing protein
VQVGLDDEIIEEFRQDAAEILAEAELALMAMDRGEDFSPNYNAVFRALHSIKGSAGMLGMDLLKKNVHHLETLLERSKGVGEIPTEVVDYLLRGIDATKEILHGNTPDFPLIDPLDGAAPKADTSAPPVAAPSPEPFVDAKAPQAKPCLEGDFSSYKVLLFDQNRISQELIGDVCKREGFNLRTANNVDEFFEFLSSTAPDIVFCSYKNTDLTPTETISKIKAINPVCPVIFVANTLSAEDCRVGFKGGAQSMLQANCSESQVLSALMAAYDRCQLSALVNRCIDLVLYQFSDLDDYLKEKGKDKVRKSLQADVTELVESRKKVIESKGV